MRGDRRVFRLTGGALSLVLAAVGLSGMWHGSALPDSQAAMVASPPEVVVERVVEEPVDPQAIAGPDNAEIVRAAVAQGAGAAPVSVDPPGYIRIPRPAIQMNGQRRVGIQAGHWLTQEATPDLGRIVFQTGTSWAGVTEVGINLDMANRVSAILTAKNIAVDILPTNVPPGYLADAFISLHGDGDGTGAKSGFKAAHSTRRTPFEDRFMALIVEEYANTTGLSYDQDGVSRAMVNYYAHAWSRIRGSTSPFTPSVILEMGFVSNDWDRYLMTDRAEFLADGIARSILRFLDENPRSKLFGSDLIVTAQQPRPGAQPPIR